MPPNRNRAFLVVMDSVGIGGAPDASSYFNGLVPDTGANTLGHIAQPSRRIFYSINTAKASRSTAKWWKY